MKNALHSFTVLAFLALSFSATAQTTRNVGVAETYTTIAAAISAAGAGDIINVVDATHTEHDINVNKNVTIQGQGADATIIQGATSANSLSGRVFEISAGVTATVQDMTIRYGDVSGQGGGIYIGSTSTLNLYNCRLTQNRAGNGGGGIYNASYLNITGCTIDNNSNTGGYGGGLNLTGATTTNMTNCTVTDNTAINDSGGFEVAGTLTVINSTIANNTAGGSGGGIYVIGTVTLKNTILAGNSPNNCNSFVSTSQGYNLESGTGCGCTATGDQQSTDPMLGTLADNGGPTPTIALSSSSPAIDPASSNGAPATDQRGASRTGNADIGAYEYNGTLPVELTSFAACVRNGNVLLEWHTASEINNYGFEVQRNIRGAWESIGFVDGHGTSNAPRGYSFADIRPPAADVLTYRLKQIDRDGSYEYSGTVEAHFGNTVHTPALGSNYPNPFSVSTSISYVLPHATQASLRIFDMHGILVNELVNRYQQEGSYSIAFGAGDLPAGTYMIQLETPTGLDVRRMSITR